MKGEDLRKMGSEWQKILRLMDWRFEIRFVDTDEMRSISSKKKNAPVGYCVKNGEKRDALIVILSQKYWKKKDDLLSVLEPTGMDRDVEGTLLHEMLHILLHPMVVGIEGYDALDLLIEEQVVSSLSGALLSAKYGGD